jgi:hypothetical protein
VEVADDSTAMSEEPKDKRSRFKATRARPNWLTAGKRSGLALVVLTCAVMALLLLGFIWHAQLGDARRALSESESRVRALQAQDDSLASQINAPPSFVLVTDNFAGPCSDNGCPVSGSFRNDGGQGSAVAIFRVTSPDGSTTTYATCSAAIPSSPKFGAASVGCTASSADLSDFFKSHPNGRVGLRASVSNP